MEDTIQIVIASISHVRSENFPLQIVEAWTNFVSCFRIQVTCYLNFCARPIIKGWCYNKRNVWVSWNYVIFISYTLRYVSHIIYSNSTISDLLVHCKTYTLPSSSAWHLFICRKLQKSAEIWAGAPSNPPWLMPWLIIYSQSRLIIILILSYCSSI